jgi:hypothetical protein
MTTTIQITRIQYNPNFVATADAPGVRFEAIDFALLSAVAGGKAAAKAQPAAGHSGSNWLQSLGSKLQSAGEIYGAAAAVSVPFAEVGVPEALAAAGGTSWLVGKGLSWVGHFF